MTDLREAILARLLVVLEGEIGPGGLQRVWHNRLHLEDDELPSATLLDGDETRDGDEERRRYPAKAPRLMVLTPQVVIAVGSQSLGLLRRRIVKAVLGDATLIALTGRDPKGDLDYLGYVTDLALGREQLGRMALNFAFGYVLKPDDL